MENKVLTSFLLFFFLVLICNAQIKTEGQNDKIVEINYKEKINGYSVNMYFMPKYIRYDLTIGPAIIEFINEQKPYESFTITNNFFSFSSEKISTNIDEYNFIKTLNTYKITTDYKSFELQEDNSVGHSNIPFFFFDIDFDGEKELIVCQTGQGQRGMNSYKIYGKISYKINGKIYVGSDWYARYTDIDLDARSKIDISNKKIESPYANSASTGGTKTYAYKNERFQLVKIEDYDYDYKTGKKYKSIYSVENGIKKLISKVEIEN